MGRYNDIKNAYRFIGREATFYDGMITCSTLLGKLICKAVWNMNQEDNTQYLTQALSGIPENFAGRLLEVPVGTGVLTMPIYQRLRQADITCLDYSDAMLAKAQKRAEQHELQHVQFQQGDVGQLPFDDASFDVVLSLNGLHAFPDKEAAHSEIYRVLKPGGIFCGCLYVKFENRRTDWFIEHLYEPRGFFTSPYESSRSLTHRLHGLYEKSTVETVQGMACFCSQKGE